MNAIELKAIVNYLIESYCDNVNGDFVGQAMIIQPVSGASKPATSTETLVII